MALNLRKNTVWAVGEVIASTVVLFLLYKIVVSSLGVKALGIWSLVLATTSLGRFADIGTASGLGRFIAAAEARDNPTRALLFAETAVTTNLILYLIIATILAVPAYFGLAWGMQGDALLEGRQLLPYSLLSFVLIGVTGATSGAIVGQQRSYQKSIIVMAGLIVQFTIAALLVPRFGLRALAWAQVGQYLVIICAGWVMFLKNHFTNWIFRLPFHWNKEAFKELFRFGVRLQFLSIVSIGFDATQKFLMSSLGGLALLGYLEMTQRMLVQAKQIVTMPNQALVPMFSHLQEREVDKIGSLYHAAVAASVLVGLPLLGGITLASPIICYFWIGHVEAKFVVLSAIYFFGWFANLLAVPAYSLGVGVGHLKWNIYGATLTACGTGFFGYLLGKLFGGFGVSVASSSMLVAGAVLTMVMNCRSMGLAVLPEKREFYGVVERAIEKIKLRSALG